MPHRFFVAASCIALLALTGCAGNRYCLQPQDYQAAGSVPSLSGTGELTVPTSPSALQIPPEPASSVPFGTTTADDEPVCLDQPPRVNVRFVEAEDAVPAE